MRASVVLSVVLLLMLGCGPVRVESEGGQADAGKQAADAWRDDPSMASVMSALESTDASVRLDAVRRLAGIHTDSALQVLVVSFPKEAPSSGGPGSPALRQAMLEAAGQIGTATARRWVMGQLLTTLDHGPGQVRYVRYNTDYCAVVRGGIRALSVAAVQDKEAESLLQSLVTQPRWHNRLDVALREEAAAAVVVVEMAHRGLRTEEERARFLASQLTGTGSGHVTDWLQPGVKTVEATRNSAMSWLLVRMGAPGELAAKTALESTGPADAARTEALRDVLGRIEAARRRMQSQQPQGQNAGRH